MDIVTALLTLHYRSQHLIHHILADSDTSVVPVNLPLHPSDLSGETY